MGIEFQNLLCTSNVGGIVFEVFHVDCSVTIIYGKATSAFLIPNIILPRVQFTAIQCKQLSRLKCVVRLAARHSVTQSATQCVTQRDTD